MAFNITYDTSVDSAPAGFKPAFQDAVHAFSSMYDDPITINIAVGWGELAGLGLDPSNNAQSLANQTPLLTYSQVLAALVGDAKSLADATAVGSLPAADPTGGANFIMSRAEGKALGVVPGDSSVIDGVVGFRTTLNWTFDPNNRSVPGEVDFIGIAEHEISEVMGRYGITQQFCGACVSPLDLFRYTAPAVRDFTPANGSYFSIDGGKTNIKTFNGTGGGDLADWAGPNPDAFNAFTGPGQQQPFSAADATLMDVIGYDPVPEPGTFTLLGLGFAGFMRIRRRRTS